MLRYTADRYSVVYVLSLFAVQIAVWRYATPAVAAVMVVFLFLAGVLSAPINHNHQHVNIFRRALLNRVFELPLALQTGVGPYSWVLHHNLGHHLNYLQQHPGAGVDESRWTRPDGSRMARLEYAVRLLCSHPVDIFRVGRKHPRIYRKYLLMRVPLFALSAVLCWVNPVNYSMVFIAAPLLTLLHTCWVTYEHHAGLGTDDHLHASYNRENKLYNLLSQNLGYHTAHHMRPGVHWSLLPAYHREIRAEIPVTHITQTFW